MPSGEIHEHFRKMFGIWFYIVVGLLLTIFVGLGKWLIVSMLGSALVSFYFTKWIDPDLDQIGRTKSETRMLQSFGPVLGRIFHVYWTTYAGLMHIIATAIGIAHPLYGAHRTWLTHSLIPGTLIRWIWFNLPAFSILGYYEQNLLLYMPYILIGFAGQLLAFAFGDYIHIYLDNNYKEKNNDRIKRLTRTRSTTRHIRRDR